MKNGNLTFRVKIMALAFIWFPISVLSSPKEDRIKIGVLLPNTGALSNIAKTHFWGHEFAVKEINALGGIGKFGKKIELMYGDTKVTMERN